VTAAWWWSVPLAGLGLVGQYLAGQRSWLAWVIGLADEAIWVGYAAWSGQWLFAVSAVFYGWVYARNLLAWRQGDSVETQAARPDLQAWEAVRRRLQEVRVSRTPLDRRSVSPRARPRHPARLGELRYRRRVVWRDGRWLPDIPGIAG
jgi:hypothetical protein